MLPLLACALERGVNFEGNPTDEAVFIGSIVEDGDDLGIGYFFDDAGGFLDFDLKMGVIEGETSPGD